VRAVDGVVVGVLLAWFVLSPAFVDDGWISIRQRNYSELGAFSNYYDTYGANIPLMYWLEWLQHWLASATNELVFLRVPTLLALIASWFVSRWCHRRVVGGLDTAAGRWTLATVFLLVAMAWGMTLRPEPIVCFLVVASLAAALSFVESPRPGPLAVSVIASALAITAHPAGLTAAAPLLAIAPQVLRAVRGAVLSVTTLLVVAIAGLTYTALLVFADTDVRAWLDDRRLFEFSTYYSAPWWWEPGRYIELLDHGWATPVRHMSVAALLFTVVAYLARRRDVAVLSVIPARSLALALLLFVFTPSKNAWHFGALAGLGAVAAGIEAIRLVRYGRVPKRKRFNLLAPALVAVVAGWCWLTTSHWNALDLRTTTWLDAFRALYAPLIPILGVGVLVVVLSFARRRRERSGDDDAAFGRALAVWSLPLAAAAPIIGLTMAILAVDSVREPGWTLAHQNLAALAGNRQCGLADELRVPAAAGGGSSPLAALLRTPGTFTLLDAGTSPYYPCARVPGVHDGVVDLPSLEVVWPDRTSLIPSRDPASSFGGVGDLYVGRRVARTRSGTWIYRFDTSVAGSVLAPAARSDGRRSA
jgi:hypothetical protein